MMRKGKVIFLLVESAMALTMSIASVSLAETRETWISNDAYAYCEEIGEQYNICPELLMAVIEKESSGQATATNGNCVGLMQVSARWHGDRMMKLGATDLYCERDNILVAADYLSELFTKYKEPSLVLDIYNGNSNAMRNYDCGVISDYARDILDRAAELERLHGK